jgi:type VI secretion system secreted protein VgrG
VKILKQYRRLLKLHSPVGEQLVPYTFEARESISGLFELRLELRSAQGVVSHQAVLGREATLEVLLEDGSSRYWSGIIRIFERLSNVDRGDTYVAVLVPWLWLLTEHRDYKIFQDKTTRVITSEILSKLGFSDFEFRISQSLLERPYCVQYNETAFAFLSRLFEQEGLHYWFEHVKGKHTLVIGDSKANHKAALGEALRYRRGHASTDDGDSVTGWEHRQSVHTGRWITDDYHYEKPEQDLSAASLTVGESVSNRKLEWFDFPAKVSNPQQSEDTARIRMEMIEVGFEQMRASSNCRRLAAGTTFTLREHPTAAYNTDYLITEVSIRATSSADDDFEDSFHLSFTCLPKAVPFRPQKQTPWPQVFGLHAGVVVGASGDEVHTDALGRIKVQFHWDRHGKNNDESSCWIRVVQPVAGKGWGFLAIPRVGQEVLVGHLYGDIDRPVVMGGLYNGTQRSPYDAAAAHTVTGIKTNSTKGGGGFNELRLDDKQGQELIYLQAQKDYEQRVLNDQRVTTLGEVHQLTAKNRYEQTEGETHLAYGALLSAELQHDLHAKVQAAVAAEIGKLLSVKAGTSIVLEAGNTITLKAGSSTVVLGPAGVTIDGATVKVNSGGSPGSTRSPSKPKPPKQARSSQGGSRSNTQQALAKRMKQAAGRGNPFVKL